MKNSFLLALVCLLGSLGLQGQVNVEAGIDLAFGQSQIAPVIKNAAQGITRNLRPSLSSSLKLDLHLSKTKINIGVGVGYENRGHSTSYASGNTWERNSQMAILPFSFGYRSDGNIYFFADVILTPYLIFYNASPSVNDSGELYQDINNPDLYNTFGLQYGGQAGLGFSLNENISLRSSILVKTDMLPTAEPNLRIMSLMVNLGFRCTL